MHEASLAAVERRQPGMACTMEFLGFALMLRDKYAEAAEAYHRAQSCSDCPAGTARRADVQRSAHAGPCRFPRTGPRGLPGAQEGARRTATRTNGRSRRRGSCASSVGASRTRTAARHEAAHQRLIDGMAPGRPRVRATRHRRQGREGVREGRPTRVPIADYHRARLKLQRGEIDTCWELFGACSQGLAGRGEVPDSGRSRCLVGHSQGLALPKTLRPAGGDTRSLTEAGRKKEEGNSGGHDGRCIRKRLSGRNQCPSGNKAYHSSS
jgi:hypothetical protein